mmetsp:Transcript_5485/g.11498  ORF Transcript_5485/g.11498 Transcript_5485/m.11498 type:complete len:230 (+) Transcript_5485:846-1535(+)
MCRSGYDCRGPELKHRRHHHHSFLVGRPGPCCHAANFSSSCHSTEKRPLAVHEVAHDLAVVGRGGLLRVLLGVCVQRRVEPTPAPRVFVGGRRFGRVRGGADGEPGKQRPLGHGGGEPCPLRVGAVVGGGALPRLFAAHAQPLASAAGQRAPVGRALWLAPPNAGLRAALERARRCLGFAVRAEQEPVGHHSRARHVELAGVSRVAARGVRPLRLLSLEGMEGFSLVGA